MTDLFGDDKSPDPNDLGSWVGDGKKYATQEEALKAVPHSQSHITKLEGENTALRTQVEELSKKLEEGGASKDDILKAVQDLAKANVSSVQTKQIDETAINELVNQTIDQRTAAQRNADNLAAAQAALVEKFGDAAKASEALKLKAAELGVGIDFLKGVAESSPKALVSYFQDQRSPDPEPKPNPTPNIGDRGAPPAGEPQAGTKAYFDKMRREDPKRYHSAEVLAERSKALQEQGEDFYK